MKKTLPVLILQITCLALLLFSCASTKTMQDQYMQAAEFFRDRDFRSAAGVIEAEKNTGYREKDRVLFYLDAGMLYHFSGDYEKSNEYLSAAEQAIEELYTASISRALLSGILNDNVLDYSGEDYEDIYLNVFKALNYIALGSGESALVEIRRVHIKLGILEGKYRKLIEIHNSSGDRQAELIPAKNRFHNDALARCLGLLLYRAEGSLDDARIELDEIRNAFSLQQHLYPFDLPPLPDPLPDENKARLSVIAFTGNSPRKLAETFYIQTTPDLLWIVSTTQDKDYVKSLAGFDTIFMPGIKGGFHFKFQYPRMEMLGSRVDRIELAVEGHETTEVNLLEDMEKVSREVFLIRQPFVLGKTVLRTVAKNMLKESGKQEAGKSIGKENPLLGLLLGVAADIAVDATENADLRISPYFPAYAGVAEISLKPGNYSISIDYYSGSTLVFRDFRGNVDVRSGELNLLESFFLE